MWFLFFCRDFYDLGEGGGVILLNNILRIGIFTGYREHCTCVYGTINVTFTSKNIEDNLSQGCDSVPVIPVVIHKARFCLCLADMLVIVCNGADYTHCHICTEEDCCCRASVVIEAESYQKEKTTMHRSQVIPPESDIPSTLTLTVVVFWFDVWTYGIPEGLSTGPPQSEGKYHDEADGDNQGRYRGNPGREAGPMRHHNGQSDAHRKAVHKK